jgi:hypothetical protein
MIAASLFWIEVTRAALVCCAVLCCAVLCCAVLCCAVLCCAVLCCAVLCCAVLCCVMQDFNPLVYSNSQQSQSSLSDLPHSQWTSTEGRQQLHDYQLQQQQPQVLSSSGLGSVRPQAKTLGGGSAAGSSRLDSQVL